MELTREQVEAMRAHLGKPVEFVGGGGIVEDVDGNPLGVEPITRASGTLISIPLTEEQRLRLGYTKEELKW